MRVARLISFVVGALVLGVGVLGPACQDPTQMTLELSVARAESCASIAGGTTITVGADADAVERRVTSGFVDARTQSCDPATGAIGTLVVTPSSNDGAAVLVVAGVDGASPDACKPPDFAGCIVARRRFAFASGASLRLPIVLDVACAGVACDALSTCVDGACVSSETTCSGATCDGPRGRLDGGLPLPDAGPDASLEDLAWCNEDGTLVCPQMANADCGHCCLNARLGCSCEPTGFACCRFGEQDVCPSGFVCRRGVNERAGRCSPATLGESECKGEALHCRGEPTACSGTGMTCCPDAPTCLPQSAPCPNGAARLCCSDSDCPNPTTCQRFNPAEPGSCL